MASMKGRPVGKPPDSARPYTRFDSSSYAPATAQKNINLTTLQKLVVPLCSLEEQRVLVDRVESILSVVEEQESAVDRQLAAVDVLRQSILKKAFSGHIVAQDPSDEPASVLLEKIRTERVKGGKSSPTTNSLLKNSPISPWRVTGLPPNTRG